MKQLYLIISLAFLVVVVVVKLFSYFTAKNEVSKESLDLIRLETAIRRKEVFIQPRLPLLSRKEDHLSSRCIDYMMDIRGINIKNMADYPVNSIHFPKNDQLCEGLPTILAEKEKNYVEACKDFMSVKEPMTKKVIQEKTGECQKKAFILKAAMTQFVTRKINLNDINDSKVLIDKIYDLYQSNSIHGVAVAERLIAVEPDWDVAERILLNFLLLEIGLKKRSELGPESWYPIEKTFERIKNLIKDEKTLFEMQLFISLYQSKSFEEFQQKTSSITSFPGSSTLLAYYRAWAEYEMLDKTQAIKTVKNYKDLKIDSERFMETYRKIMNNIEQPFRCQIELPAPADFF